MTGLKEFNTTYTYDAEDILSLGFGSGVHNDEDILINFSFLDRLGEPVLDTNGVVKNKYISSIVYDIADIDGNIVYENYKSGVEPFLNFTKKQNEFVFNGYQKDIGVYIKVNDNTTTETNSGFMAIYGNSLEISGIEARDSFGLTKFKENKGIFLDVSLSEYRFSGKMYQSPDPNTPLVYYASGVNFYPEMPSGFQHHPWDASLSWSYDKEMPPSPSYEFTYEPEGIWSLIIDDLSPSGLFFIAGGSSDVNNPHGYYSDANGSGYIKDNLIDPEVIESGSASGYMEASITYLNSQEFTSKSHIEAYTYVGDELDLAGFEFAGRFESFDMDYLKYTEQEGLRYNEKTWIKFIPYSKLGAGESWIVGPLTSQKKQLEDDQVRVNQIEMKGGQESVANINFKQGNLLDIQEDGSGVLDRLLVYKDVYGRQEAIYERGGGLKFDFYTVPTTASGEWLNSSFDYKLEFKSESDAYKNTSKNIKLTATGASLEQFNLGLPLFNLEVTDGVGGSGIDVQMKYCESGVSLLANIEHEYKKYKFYKTSL